MGTSSTVPDGAAPSFTEQQQRDMIRLFIDILDTREARHNRRSGNENNGDVSNHLALSPVPPVPAVVPNRHILRAEDIGFFNPEANEASAQGKHVIYLDVYTFVDWLMLMAAAHGEVAV